MTISERFEEHQKAVERIRRELDGTSFSRAPFDLVDKKSQFYEVKVVGQRKGRHYDECRFSISEDEIKFGQIFDLVFILLFDNPRHFIPFEKIHDKIMRNRVGRYKLWGVIRERRQITLGKKFLSQFKV